MQSLSPYPSLTLEFEHFFPIAKLYGIDLSDANHKAWGGGRFGAVENDLNLDIVGSIHEWTHETNRKLPLLTFVMANLNNWGYEPKEFLIRLAELNNLEEKK